MDRIVIKSADLTKSAWKVTGSENGPKVYYREPQPQSLARKTIRGLGNFFRRLVNTKKEWIPLNVTVIGPKGQTQPKLIEFHVLSLAGALNKKPEVVRTYSNSKIINGIFQLKSREKPSLLLSFKMSVSKEKKQKTSPETKQSIQENTNFFRDSASLFISNNRKQMDKLSELENEVSNTKKQEKTKSPETKQTVQTNTNLLRSLTLLFSSNLKKQNPELWEKANGTNTNSLESSSVLLKKGKKLLKDSVSHENQQTKPKETTNKVETKKSKITTWNPSPKESSLVSKIKTQVNAISKKYPKLFDSETLKVMTKEKILAKIKEAQNNKKNKILFELPKVLGKGSYSTVMLGLVFNIKTKELVAASRKTTSIEEHEKIQKVLKKYKNIPQILAPVLYEKRNLYNIEIAEELLSTDLEKYQNEINPEKLYEITHDILTALVELHKNGYVHNDIKPANIMLSLNKKMAKLIDFGFITQNGVQEFSIAGSPIYMAPEVINRSSIGTSKSDCFSFGVTLGELLHKRDPYDYKAKGFGMQDLIVATQKGLTFPPLSQPDNETTHLQTVITNLLKVNPDNRWTAKQALYYLPPPSLARRILSRNVRKFKGLVVL